MGRKHIAPHRWADLAEGRLSLAQERSLVLHADDCARCSRERARVLAARDAFADIRDDAVFGAAGSPPELNWEHIGARIHWVTSSERRGAKTGETRAVSLGRRWWRSRVVVGAGVSSLALGALGVGLLALNNGGTTVSKPGEIAGVVAPIAGEISDRSFRVPAASAALSEPNASPITGIVTFAQGSISHSPSAVASTASPLRFDQAIAAGQRIRTGDDGRVTVQLGASSGFTLGPQSSVVLRSLDSHRVELVLEGSITVDITKRKSQQSFAVVAGDRVVSVRGTAFRVENRVGSLAVSCARGRVAVSGSDTEVEVSAGQVLRLSEGDQLAGRAPVALAAAACDVLESEVRVRMLPAWASPEALKATSSTLRLAAPMGHPVRVDGASIGAGTFAVRVMSGRHHVEIDGREGRWMSLEAGGDQEAVAAKPRPVESKRNSHGAHGRAKAAKVRRGQLARALRNGARVRPCLRTLEKQGLLNETDDSANEPAFYAKFDIGVNTDGSLGHLNLLRSNLPRQVTACIRSVIDGVSLPKGPRITLRYRLTF